MKELRTITKKELKNIIDLHEKWIKSEGKRGSRADLSYTDLRWEKLRSADLGRANLEGADISFADLYDTNLGSANLREAKLIRADLRKANLRMAHLEGADLTFAELGGSDMGGEIERLNGARYLVPFVCPVEGAFIAWKKAIGWNKSTGKYYDNYPYDEDNWVIVKILIPEDALRSSGTSRICRASKAVVLGIQNMKGEPLEGVTAHSKYDHRFVYETGKTVESNGFDENRFNEDCVQGIYFFVDRREAVEYIP